MFHSAGESGGLGAEPVTVYINTNVVGTHRTESPSLGTALAKAEVRQERRADRRAVLIWTSMGHQ